MGDSQEEEGRRGKGDELARLLFALTGAYLGGCRAKLIN